MYPAHMEHVQLSQSSLLLQPRINSQSDPNDEGQHVSEHSLDPGAASGNEKQMGRQAEFHYSKQNNTGVNHPS